MSSFPLGSRKVNRVGFGAMQLPGRRVFGPPRDRDEAIAMLRRAVKHLHRLDNPPDDPLAS